MQDTRIISPSTDQAQQDKMSVKQTVNELRRRCAHLRIPVRQNKRMLTKAALVAALERHAKTACAAQANIRTFLRGHKKSSSKTTSEVHREQVLPTSQSSDG